MRSHFQLHWWKYLPVILLPIFIWCNLFQAAAKPKANEQVNILFIGQEFDCDMLQDAVTAALPERTAQSIRSVTVSQITLPETGYASLLTARCFDYDILIFAESCMPKNIGQDVFVRLTEPLLAQFPDEAPYTEVIPEGDCLSYGLWISPDARFMEYYAGTDRCCLFVSPYSVNFDTLNETGTVGQNAALKCAQYLLENPL